MERSNRRSRNLWGIVTMVLTTLLMIASVLVFVLPKNSGISFPIVTPTAISGLPEPSLVLESISGEPDELLPVIMPTISDSTVAELLLTPVLASVNSDLSIGGASASYDPFTVIPERDRTEMTEYVVQAGDTVVGIASRFGLQAETIAWCNDPQIVFLIRVGDVLNIPPTNGACHTTLGTRQETLRSIAEQFDLDDPYALIEEGYNEALGSFQPDTVLPSGMLVFVPGGEGQDVVWGRPQVEEVVDETTGVQRTFVTFASGQAGSCGRVPAEGGTSWANPLPNGRWVRGFFPGHGGIDLSAASGTPILAANSGPVIFAGFSEWGYGNTVVLAHGSILSTLYGHMSQLAVKCGDYVVAGQVIGYVGSTGNSSGPHLHFEIRSNGEPQDPTATAGIGWSG